MALRQNPKQRVIPNEAVAKKIFAELFGDKINSVSAMLSPKVKELLTEYSDEDDHDRKECELEIANALIAARVASLFEEDFRAYPVVSNLKDRVVRVNTKIVGELVSSEIPIEKDFINETLRTVLEKKISEHTALAAELEEIKKKRRERGENSNPVIRVIPPVIETTTSVRSRLMNSVLPLSFVACSILGGVKLADRFFSPQALSEGGEMKGMIADAEVTDAAGPSAPASSLATAPQTAPPTVFNIDLDADAYVEEGGTYRVKLIHTPNGDVLLDKIKWVGRIPAPIEVKKCEAVNAVQIDSEVVGLECPYMGRTVTLAIEKRDVDMDSTRWQNIPTRIKRERKK